MINLDDNGLRTGFKNWIYKDFYSRSYDLSFQTSLAYLSIILYIGGEYLSAVAIKKCGVDDWDFFASRKY